MGVKTDYTCQHMSISISMHTPLYSVLLYVFELLGEEDTKKDDIKIIKKQTDRQMITGTSGYRVRWWGCKKTTNMQR